MLQVQAEVVTCDRCKGTVAGVRIFEVAAGGVRTIETECFYDLTVARWRNYGGPGERTLCHACLMEAMDEEDKEEDSK
jgi:hypothetical protein